MVKSGSPPLDSVFGALSDATRRGILAQLAREGASAVSDLSEPYSMTAPAISKHLRVLEDAGLIERERRGRVRICRLNTRALGGAQAWLDSMTAFWEGQLDALAHFLRDEDR